MPRMSLSQLPQTKCVPTGKCGTSDGSSISPQWSTYTISRAARISLTFCTGGNRPCVSLMTAIFMIFVEQASSLLEEARALTQTQYQKRASWKLAPQSRDAHRGRGRFRSAEERDHVRDCVDTENDREKNRIGIERHECVVTKVEGIEVS